MSRDDENDFEPRLGRIGNRRERGPRPPPSFRQQVMRAVARAGGDPRRIGSTGGTRVGGARSGRFNARGRGAKLAATFPRESGWSFDREAGMRFRSRRVTVKARVVKMRGQQSQAVQAHLRYLQREGVTLDGERGQLYSAHQQEADGSLFLDRGVDDRHQFRLIVAPEDGAELGDLRRFTRELMAQMERDLETDLDWVAVDHHNTGHPHTHVVIRGVTDDGKILNIAGDYIAHGIRYRASEIATLELGPQSEWEVQQQLGREADQERFTRIDRAILAEVNQEGLVDMRMSQEEGFGEASNRYLMVARLKKLERMGLAREEKPARWSLSSETEKMLREMGERGDIIKTMHRALSERGIAQSPDQYVIHHGSERQRSVVGRVIDKGLAGDGLSGRLHVVVDGIDGRAHYAEMPEAAAAEVRIGSIVELGQARAKPRESDRNIAEQARENGNGIYEPAIHLVIARDTVRVPGDDHESYVLSHIRRLEALRRAGIVERLDDGNWRIPADFGRRAQDYDTERAKELGVRVLSRIDLSAQLATHGATWLDRQLIGEGFATVRDGGFGHEVRGALAARRQWLVEQGLARENETSVTYRSDMLAVLARREVRDVGRKLAQERGKPFYQPENGERISGVYRQPVEMVSGKYALVETGRHFVLVPWRALIEKELGRQVTGLIRGDGISWELGRQRGLGI
jgi:type IV secretory pathway VirD2 relaxase